MTTKSNEPSARVFYANLTEIQDTNRIKVAIAACPNQSVMDVISYIHGEMTKNATGPDATSLRKLLSLYWTDALAITGPLIRRAQAYIIFAELVWPRSKWDHKGYILKNYRKLTCDLKKHTRYHHDIWSNIHYGYIGYSCGFSQWELLSGAGGAQVLERTVPEGYWKRRARKLGDADFLSAFDDDFDQEAIKVGIELWDAHKTSVTTQNILDIVRERSGLLHTESCSFKCVKHK